MISANEQIIQQVVELLKKDKNVAAGYIFGSRAIGTFTPESDLDLAVICSPSDTQTSFWAGVDLKNRLEDRLNLPVDVVDLERIPPYFAQEILINGRLIMEKDPERRIEVEIKVRREYWDVLPYREYYRREVLGLE